MTSGFVPAIARWWWLLVVAALVAGGTAYLASSRVPPTYEAETRLLVGPVNTDRETLRAASELAQTYAALATSKPLVARAVRRVPGIEAGEPSVDATANDVTRLISVRARHGDPGAAAALANAVADELVAVPSQGIARPEGQLQVIERAEPSTEAVGPDRLAIAPLAALAGLLGALALALLLDALNRTVRSGEQLGRFDAVPFLGSVDGAGRENGAGPLVVAAKPESAAAAAYRLLAARLAWSGDEELPRRLLVAAAGDRDVAAPVAANLAAALATLHEEVALVDATESGSLAKLLTPKGDQARAQVAERERAVAAPVTILEQFRVRTQPGLLVVRPAQREALDEDGARALVERLLEDARLVVVAGPPLGRSPQAITWARVTDATVVTVGRERTREEDVAIALETLRLARVRIAGTVLDGATH